MKIFEKNAFLDTETMEFGGITINLPGSHPYCPFIIEKLYKFVRIGILAQNKTSIEINFFLKIPFRRPKRWNLAKK